MTRCFSRYILFGATMLALGAPGMAGVAARKAARTTAAPAQQSGAPQGVRGHGGNPSIPFQAGRPALTARPQGDAAIIRTVIDAVGLIRLVPPRETTEAVNRLEWRATGTMMRGGVAAPITEYRYALSLHQTAAREDVQLAGKPARRLIQVVAGGDAWDESAPGVASSLQPKLAKERRLQLARTPFGLAHALAKAAPGSVKVTDRGPSAPVELDLTIENVPTHVVLDAQYRPAVVAQTIDGVSVVDRYAKYKDMAEYGIMFPASIVTEHGGKRDMSLTVTGARVASYLIFPAPTGSAVPAASH